MGAYLVLRDSWLLEDDTLLDSIKSPQAQAGGTFYPIGLGPESCAGIACPDLWGYLVPPSEAEAFESLFSAHENEQIAKLYAKRFVYARWRDGAGGKPEVGFLPAPVLKETPLRTASARRQPGRAFGRGIPPPSTTSTCAAIWSQADALPRSHPKKGRSPPPVSESPRRTCVIHNHRRKHQPRR